MKEKVKVHMLRALVTQLSAAATAAAQFLRVF